MSPTGPDILDSSQAPSLSRLSHCPRQPDRSVPVSPDSPTVDSRQARQWPTVSRQCPRQSTAVPKPGLFHLQDALNDTTTSRDSPGMHQDQTHCSFLAQVHWIHQYGFVVGKGDNVQGAVVQNLQTQISPFQSPLRANNRVERGTKRIAYLFSPHSASFRG